MTKWQEVKLGEICTIIDGDRGKNYPKSNELQPQGYCLFLNTKNVPDNKFNFSECTFISKDKDELLGKGKLNYGDIVVTTRGTLANFAYYTKKCIYNKIRINSGMVILRNENKDLCTHYLYHFLISNNFKQQVQSLATGSAQPQLPIKDMKNIIMNLPPIDIQKKIAGVLGALDDKIELNNRINNNLEQQAQVLFNNIYNTNNNGTLADIVDVVESGSRPKGGAINKGIPSIGAENIEKFGVYDYSKEKFIDEIFYEKMKHGKVAAGDVLLYKDGAYTGKVSLALDGYPHRICAVNEHVFIIRGKSDVTSQFFLYFCLSDEKNKNYLHTLASSKAAQPGLNQSELLGLPIFIPASAVVKNFTLSVAPMMHKIASNAIENNKLSALRDTLLPKLMSGEVDVSKVDISALTSTDKLSFNEGE